MFNKITLFRLIILGCLFAPGQIFCLDLNLPVSASQNAANGLNILIKDPSSSFRNPSLLNPGLCSSTTSLYSLKGLLLHHLSIAGNIKNNFGISTGCRWLDHPAYKEIAAALGLSYSIENFTTGIQTRYLYNKVEQYHKFGRILFDLALTWSSGNSESTIVYKNLLQQKMLGDRIPSFLIWETGFKISEKIELALGLEKQQQEEFIFKFGSRCNVQQFLSLLVSCQHDPARLGAGVILQIRRLKLTYGIRTHQYLPYTHSISLTYEIPGN